MSDRYANQPVEKTAEAAAGYVAKWAKRFVPISTHEDLFQACYLGAWRVLPYWRPDGGRSKFSYMVVGARNDATRFIRAHRRYGMRGPNDARRPRVVSGAKPNDETTGWLELVAARHDNPEAAVEVSELLSLLDDQSAEVMRHRMAGMTLREVGAELGCSKARVGQIEEAALRLIREKIGVRTSRTPGKRFNREKVIA